MRLGANGACIDHYGSRPPDVEVYEAIWEETAGQKRH